MSTVVPDRALARIALGFIHPGLPPGFKEGATLAAVFDGEGANRGAAATAG
jgi:hypothetical protein